MKRAFRWLGLLFLVVLLAGCGAKEPTIKAPAAEMNLTGDSLGKPATTAVENGREEVLQLVYQEPADTRLATDASMRTFTFSNTQLIAAVLVLDSSATAKGALRDARENFEKGLEDGLESDAGQNVDLTMQDLNPAQAGEEGFFVGTDLPAEKGKVYFLSFRKNNVLVLLVGHGPAAELEEGWVRDLAQKMAGRLPAATP